MKQLNINLILQK